MFFLGLLSTPLPYLLLAAFYFFGFAMGMFNNSTDEDMVESATSVTIPVEVKQKEDEHAVYDYFQAYKITTQNHAVTIIPEDSASFFPPGTETVGYPMLNEKIQDFCFSGFRFSRPPPFGC